MFSGEVDRILITLMMTVQSTALTVLMCTISEQENKKILCSLSLQGVTGVEWGYHSPGWGRRRGTSVLSERGIALS